MMSKVKLCSARWPAVLSAALKLPQAWVMLVPKRQDSALAFGSERLQELVQEQMATLD